MKTLNYFYLKKQEKRKKGIRCKSIAMHQHNSWYGILPGFSVLKREITSCSHGRTNVPTNLTRQRFRRKRSEEGDFEGKEGKEGGMKGTESEVGRRGRGGEGLEGIV